ncbi:hypothetical protein U1Q18_048785, partial [Sarracenia purpurea var. burkii]
MVVSQSENGKARSGNKNQRRERILEGRFAEERFLGEIESVEVTINDTPLNQGSVDNGGQISQPETIMKEPNSLSSLGAPAGPAFHNTQGVDGLKPNTDTTTGGPKGIGSMDPTHEAEAVRTTLNSSKSPCKRGDDFNSSARVHNWKRRAREPKEIPKFSSTSQTKEKKKRKGSDELVIGDNQTAPILEKKQRLDNGLQELVWRLSSGKRVSLSWSLLAWIVLVVVSSAEWSLTCRGAPWAAEFIGLALWGCLSPFWNGGLWSSRGLVWFGPLRSGPLVLQCFLWLKGVSEAWEVWLEELGPAGPGVVSFVRVYWPLFFWFPFGFVVVNRSPAGFSFVLVWW